MTLTDLLDLVGIAALACFAWFVWPPLVLLVVGLAALVISWQRSRVRAPAPRRRAE